MSSNPDNFRKIINELKDYIYSNHKLPSISDIAELMGISNSKCKELCEKLEGQKQIYTISGGGYGKPRVIIPYSMMENIFSNQPKPEWILEEDYSFIEINKLYNEVKKIDEEIIKYQKFQMLLYGTDIPLEKSIAFVLDYLKFKKVIHHINNKNYADITFYDNNLKYLIEVEGTTKRGDKGKVLQLDGWLGKDIEKGISAKNLKGMFIINHERDNHPHVRGGSLTPHAKEYMIRYNFILVTTPYIFKLIKQVHNGQISKVDARNKILRGQCIGDQ
ncbi:hypothetical protein MCGE09_00377 [Thaumarchaeota archaeon SCGC AB-539-E09]|nr:hypothetical protein MCGE09_00377 [Thaumarchaeota archaeon SCGC AB-539-E09]